MAYSELKHTVKPSGGDFSTVADAVAHIVSAHPNLVTADVYASIEIDGTWSAKEDQYGPINMAGLTVDSTHYVSIYTTAAARFDPHGPWDANAYNVSFTDCSGFINIPAYTRLDGLQIRMLSPTADARYILHGSNTGTGVRVSNCILRDHGNATYPSSGVYFAGTSMVFYIWNCIMYGFAGQNAVLIDNYGGEVLYIYSCTIIGSGTYGINNASNTTVYAKNCYVGGFATACYHTGGTMNQTKCASSDSSGSEAGLRGILVSTTADATHAGFVNVTAGSEDYHIKAGSPLIGTGYDTSGESAPLNFTTDIDGDSRS